MAIDFNRPDLVVGVVGTGAMGRGIAQIAAAAGCTVLLMDAREGAGAEARIFVADMLGRLAEKGRMTVAAAEAAIARIKVAATLADLAPCHVMVEAIVEDLAAKQALMRDLEEVVTAECVLASNTSSLSVTAIAAACRHAGRVAGFHFFNPVPLMKVVEVIDGIVTEPWVSEGLAELARRMGHQPVRAKDSAGFIVNHAGRGYITESLRLLGEGVAEVADIDRLLRGAAGFRMGPFELMDLTGLDVTHPVMEAIYGQFYQEPRFRPSPITRQRLAAGLLGRKSGRGFYTYDNGRAKVPPPPPVPAGRAMPVWVAPGEGSLAAAALAKTLGAEVETAARPSVHALCLVTPLGEDCTTAALRHQLDPRRTVALDTLGGIEGHRSLMVNPLTEPESRDAAHALFARGAETVCVLRDSPGFVVQRVLAAIVNVGCDIAQQGIAAPADIDKAVTLGLGYPFGPLAWGDRIGPAKVLKVLEAMHAITGDPRYRPSLWLSRRARLGASLLTPES